MKDLFRRAHHASTPEGAENSKTASSLHPTTSSFPPHSPPSVTQNDPHMGSVDADFEDLWADALRDYSARTGVDLSDRGQDLYRHLQSCTSSYSVAQTLEKVALEFHSYRKGSKRAARIRTALSCVAHGVLVFLDAGAESLASQSFPGGKAVFVAIAVLIKATQGVSKRFDALLAILEKFGFYLSRLHIRLNVGIGFESRRLAIELLSKMVHTFALATQTMRQNRLHHLINVLFNREDETEATRQRVEQLIDEDSRMSLVDIHRAISQLSDRIDEALARA
ncbi:hypothetical protein PENSPDRAFT_30323 [Peniophora sp. CONT]|nr:hypothetical protein PENSPDRAFT_30323 [Peniophora sp. CONT]